MPNKISLKTTGNSKINALQSEKKAVAVQQFRVQQSDFDAVRAKLKQIGKGRQTATLTTPLVGRNKVLLRRNNGRRI